MAIESYRGTAPGQAGGTNLADILERVLDKGVVIAGDIAVNLLDIELLTIKVRLLIASADTAQKMGIDWWQDDPFLSSSARRSELERSEDDRGDGGGGDVAARLDRIEQALAELAARGNGHRGGATP